MEKFFKYPALIVAVIGTITLFFLFQLPKAELDNNNLRFVPEDDPALEISRHIDDTFGSSLFILIGLERKYDTVFDGPFINRIREYVEKVEEIPIVRKVNSLADADYITGDGESIIVEKLVSDDFSGKKEEIEELKRRIQSWDLYKNALVSADYKATQILIPLSTSTDDAGNKDVEQSFLQIRDMAREMFQGYAEVYVTGMPVISSTINESIQGDLRLLVPMVVIVVLLVLFFSFRRFTAVILPLLTVVVAAVWSIGAMPLFGVKLSIISTVLPVILVAVGSAYGIHVITHYIEDLGLKEMNREEHRELVFALLRKIGKPVFLAALTTFSGFASFSFTRVLPIKEFGYFSSLGVMASFAVALTLIPSLLLIRGPKPLTRARAAGEHGEVRDNLSYFIAALFSAIARRRITVLVVTMLVTAVSIYGLSKIIIDNVMVEYFKADTDIARSDKFIREKFGGSKVINVMVSADSSTELLQSDVLSAMDGMGTYLMENIREVGKVMGFTDMVKRINQVFNAGESPEGLKPVAAAGSDIVDSSTDDDAFGFGSADTDGNASDTDDALGDLGFGFEEAGDGSGSNAGPATGDGAGHNPMADSTLSALDLAGLIDKAAGLKGEMSGSEVARELRRLTNLDGAAYYEIPRDPERYGKKDKEELQGLVSNYLVLLSGNISDYANDPLEPTAIKSTVQMRTLGEDDSNVVIQAIYDYIERAFPKNVKAIVGGTSMVEFSLNALVVQSQLISVAISILMVFLIITASNKSLVAGLIGILPLSISILINFAVMGFLKIKLNLGTSMVASVSVGIGIDYTIHYMEAFKREYALSGGQGDYLWRTFATSGKAILINAVSVGAGFAVLLFSNFNILADLGFLIALTMGTSALVSLTVIPALLTLIKPEFVRRQ